MINVNSVGSTAATVAVGNAAQSSALDAVETKDRVNHSTVVDIQGRNLDVSSTAGIKVSKDSAASMAKDIASLLGSRGMGVQANLNGFDAARLLAD